MYECFHCLSRSVVWDSDFTFEDYGLDGGVLCIIFIAPIAEQRLSILSRSLTKNPTKNQEKSLYMITCDEEHDPRDRPCEYFEGEEE